MRIGMCIGPLAMVTHGLNWPYGILGVLGSLKTVQIRAKLT